MWYLHAFSNSLLVGVWKMARNVSPLCEPMPFACIERVGTCRYMEAAGNWSLAHWGVGEGGGRGGTHL